MHPILYLFMYENTTYVQNLSSVGYLIYESEDIVNSRHTKKQIDFR